MGRAKPNAEQKKTLRNTAKKELERLEEILLYTATKQTLDDFKNKFNVCESVYKVILAEHQRWIGNTIDGYLKLDMRQVPYALSFAGYSFNRSLLNELFGVSSKKGTTAKKLRDAVTHGLDEKAVKEICARKEELFGYMDAFLNTIKTFDNAA